LIVIIAHNNEHVNIKVLVILSKMAERLRAEVDRIGISDLARKTGSARNTIYNWCEKGNIPLDKLLLLSNFGVDIDYVISGKHKNVQNFEHGPVECLDNEFIAIPVHDVEVSAGDGACANSKGKVNYCLAFHNDWIQARGLNIKDLHVVTARGDSMEPTISDKDYLLVNTAEKEPKDGHIYVIRSCDMLWVKRIQRLLDGSLLLISDNKIYPPMPIRLDESTDVEIIGKVVNSSKNFY